MPSPKVPKGYGFLHCRTFGHTWVIGEGSGTASGLYQFVLVCTQCHTRRIDAISRRTGGVASRHYEYPDGFRSEPGEALERTTYRLEFIHRRIKE